MPLRYMDRLTSFDTSFLANEKANGHIAIGAVLVCEGSTPSHEDFLAHVGTRLHLLPRLRQRLSFPPLRLGTPFWVDHPEFDAAAHVRAVTLPAPGTPAQFGDLAGDLLAPPLDRCWPLWELWLGDSFEDDRFGVVYKSITRSPMAFRRSISARSCSTSRREISPRARPRPGSPIRPRRRCSSPARRRGGVLATLRRALRWGRRPAREPARALRRAVAGAAGLREVGWALTKLAPNVPFNVEIGPGAASAGRAPSSPTSSRSRTPSAAASTTSHSRSRPGRCAAGCTTAMSAPTGSSCGRWSRSRSAPRTSTVSSATG